MRGKDNRTNRSWPARRKKLVGLSAAESHTRAIDVKSKQVIDAIFCRN